MSFVKYSFYNFLLSFALLISTTTAASLPHSTLPKNHGIANGIDLRILPLGASMTIGHGSSDSNAYRAKLLSHLSGNRVEYIGSQNHGNMSNNACECHSGYPIGPLIDLAQPQLPKRPNIILIIGGTNDLLHDMNVAQAPEVMGRLIDNLTDTLPAATVVVSTLPPFGNSFIDRKRPPFNRGLGPVVEKRVREGRRVMLVDPAVPVELINKKDQIHPNDVGYQMIADKFFVALVEAGMRGWISPLEEQRGGWGLRGLRGEGGMPAIVRENDTKVLVLMGVAAVVGVCWVVRKALGMGVRIRLGEMGGKMGY